MEPTDRPSPSGRKLRIILTMNLPWLRSHGGANRSNRSLAESLAARGHQVRVVVPALATPSTSTLDDYLTALDAMGIQWTTGDGCDSYHLNGVEVVSTRTSLQRGLLAQHIDQFQPDWVFVSSEDQSQNLLAGALDKCAERVIFLAHTPQMLPFGPCSLYPGPGRTERIRASAGIVTISQFVADYVEQWTGRKAFVNHPPHYGSGPFPDLSSWDSGAVLLFNPCAVKGISIFLALARHFRHLSFAAVPGYGTTADDRLALAREPNVRLLENASNLDNILSQARVLVMPSLWTEGFGMASVDAMLRGIPVLAADSGGLREAVLGAGSLLPVSPIQTYSQTLDDALLPLAEVPTQDVGPWIAALEPLMTDPEHYRNRSAQARNAAQEFVSTLSCTPLERYLSELASNRGEASAASLPPTTEAAVDSKVSRLTPEQRALLILRLNKKLRTHSEQTPLRSYPRDGPIPLSFAQRRLWILDQIEPGSTVNNITVAFRLTGHLDRNAVRSALSEIVRRHEILRTSFPKTGEEPSQFIAPFGTVPFEEISLAPDEGIDAIYERERQTPFDLEHGPIFRVKLISCHPDEHILLASIHHIASDGWSMNVIASEFAQLYDAGCTGRPSPLPPLEIQYADYTFWQRDRLKNDLATELEYWRGKLSGLTPLVLSDNNALQAGAGNGAGHVALLVPPSTATELARIASLQGATLFTVLLAAFKLTLARYTATTDVAVGTVTANRMHVKLEPLIGFLVNTLVLRTDLSGSLTFRQLVDRVKTTVLEAQQHQNVPYERLLDELAPSRDPNRPTFFQTVFVFQNQAPVKCDLRELHMEQIDSEDDSAKFDLMVAMAETGEGIVGVLSFDRDIFEHAFISRLTEHFLNILAAVARRPELDIRAVPLTSSRERDEIIKQWAGQEERVRDTTVTVLLEEQARRTPHAEALCCGPRVWTYDDLHRRANQLARFLQQRGVGPEVRVAMCLQRSEQIVITLLACLKAGGVYVPLDPDYPAERLQYMLRDAAPAVLVTDTVLTTKFQGSAIPMLQLDTECERIERYVQEAPYLTVTPKNAAYMLYTSGSTGRPKAVVIEHGCTVALLEWALRAYTRNELNAVLFCTSVSFDVSLFELLAPLCCGGRVIVSPNLLEWEGGEASLIAAVPSVVAEWRKSPAAKQLPRVMNLAGEPFPKWLAERLCTGNNGRVLNLYGPTECTTYSTLAEVVAEHTPNVGRPIRATLAYVLDERMEPVPPGVTGELYLGGPGVGRGYRDRPALTSERFLPDPFSSVGGRRLYRTGDLVRWNSDRTLEYLGRIDDQVKINGCRIELGEIETVLCSYPPIDQVAVIVREDLLGNKQLAAYWTARTPGDPPTPQAFREFLHSRLPAHMVPGAFVHLAELPRSANGKLQRSALPAPAVLPLHSRAPKDTWEERLTRIWTDVLAIGDIDPVQDFFFSGGNSLKAILLSTRLSTEFERKIPVRFVFEHRSIEQQASSLRGDASQSLPPCIVPIRKTGTRNPLFCVHPQFGFAHGYIELANLLDPDQPLYGLQSQGGEEGQDLLATIPQMAQVYLDAIRTIQPRGPYRLVGWSMGAGIAWEMACRIHDAGETVSLLALLDGRPAIPDKLPLHLKLLPRETQLTKLAEEYLIEFATEAGLQKADMRKLTFREQSFHYLNHAKGRGAFPIPVSVDHLQRILGVIASNQLAISSFKPVPRPLAAVLLRVPVPRGEDSTYGWDSLALGGLEVIEIDSTHDDLLSVPAVNAVAAAIRPLLEESDLSIGQALTHTGGRV